VLTTIFIFTNNNILIIIFIIAVPRYTNNAGVTWTKYNMNDPNNPNCPITLIIQSPSKPNCLLITPIASYNRHSKYSTNEPNCTILKLFLLLYNLVTLSFYSFNFYLLMSFLIFIFFRVLLFQDLCILFHFIPSSESTLLNLYFQVQYHSTA
jgi:hypothetical protein